ncbi:hypothetical protein niasHS_015064 [Heterodera schachtii]|uniref:LIM zinc-binding domain-containing protein n=1 Tax=Heterodera schachtii TaxID=97005 RepID=A0ABD2I130_HETSC
MAMHFGTAQDYEMKDCAICNEGVPLGEKLVVEKETIHLGCFKCAYCGTRLQVGNCAMELSFYNRYGPCWYCSLICAHLPTGEKEAKLKALGKQRASDRKAKRRHWHGKVISSSRKSFPGEKLIKTLNRWYNSFRFNFHNQSGGMQHILLDIHFLDYFLAKTEINQRENEQKIQIYTIIYLLRVKTEQNKAKLERMERQQTEEEKKREENSRRRRKDEVKEATNAYGKLDEELGNVFSKTFWLKLFDGSNTFSECSLNEFAIVYLLMLKETLFNALNAHPTVKKGKSQKANQKLENKFEAEKHNVESIREWMLSDMTLFFSTRKKLVKYFNEIATENNVLKILRINQKFHRLFGYARMAIICETNFKELAFLVPFGECPFYALLYKEVFHNDTKIGKWRTKITLEKYLYEDWAKKLFKNETEKLIKEGEFIK